jgi:hypothetical protein
MAAMTDLWGAIEGPGVVRTPVSILKEQATLLGKKTNQLLRGRVRTQAYGREVHHFFDIVVPALDDYSYELFGISHDTADLYPVTVGRSVFDKEAEFVDWLGTTLSSRETQKIVRNLLAQANS